LVSGGNVWEKALLIGKTHDKNIIYINYTKKEEATLDSIINLLFV